MSKDIVYTCDKCKKEFKAKTLTRPEGIKKLHILSEYDSSLGRITSDYDICDLCLVDVVSLIKYNLGVDSITEEE